MLCLDVNEFRTFNIVREQTLAGDLLSRIWDFPHRMHLQSSLPGEFVESHGLGIGQKTG